MERGGNKATEAPRGVMMDSKTLAVVKANEILFALMGAFGGYDVIPREVFIRAVACRYLNSKEVPFSIDEVVNAGYDLMTSFWPDAQKYRLNGE
jgi:hypothetical protein